MFITKTLPFFSRKRVAQSLGSPAMYRAPSKQAAEAAAAAATTLHATQGQPNAALSNDPLSPLPLSLALLLSLAFLVFARHTARPRPA